MLKNILKVFFRLPLIMPFGVLCVSHVIFINIYLDMAKQSKENVQQQNPLEINYFSKFFSLLEDFVYVFIMFYNVLHIRGEF